MAKYLINYLDRKSTINKDVYGNFAEHLGRCIYDGLWVGKDSPIPNIKGVRKDIIDALKAIKLPTLRWPGGCFADRYHWKDAIGPQEQRKKIVNKTWGGVVESNAFGTHEFMDMCEEIGCDVYLAGNLGTGTIQEMADWVEYITGGGDSEMANLRRQNGRQEPWKIKYFGIGNEVWGCGGEMTAEHYTNQYRQAYHFIGDHGFMVESSIKFIASGPCSDDYAWTDAVTKSLTTNTYCMSQVKKNPLMDGLAYHHYIFGGDSYFDLKEATDFDDKTWYKMLKKTADTEELIIRHDTAMSKYDPEKKVGLMVDEWGTWFKSEAGTNPAFLFQQNTMLDAVLAGVYLNIFNKHSDRIKMATIAQMINVLQAVILTEGEKIVMTPTYHVFDLYKDHQNATLLGSHIENTKVGVDDVQLNKLFESSSVDATGNVLSTIANTSTNQGETIEVSLHGKEIASVKAQVLCAELHSHNTFAEPNKVKIQDLAVKVVNGEIQVEIPAASVVKLEIKVK